MNFKFCLSISLLALCNQLCGQIIHGKILDQETDQPLIGAHIYIINSLQGTVSNVDGEFQLSPLNTYGEILITYVGFLDQKVMFSPENRSFQLKLAPIPNKLAAVYISDTEDKKWKRLYKKFEKSFLGSTKNSEQCTITNPWVVDVSKGTNGELIAKSKQPLEIINKATGYILTFYLTNFTLKVERLQYEGFVYFEELESNNSAKKEIWNKNREETYLGSKTHFIKALSTKNLEKEGFELYLAEFSQGVGFTTKSRKNEYDLLKTENELSIQDFLKVVYTNAEPQPTYLSDQKTQSSIRIQGPKADLVPQGIIRVSQQATNNQVSFLYSRDSKLSFTNTGYIINNKYIIEYGYWSWLGVAEMLPIEYK